MLLGLPLFVAGCRVVTVTADPPVPMGGAATEPAPQMTEPRADNEPVTMSPVRSFDEVRALWVVRFTMTSEEAVRAMVDDAARNGINTLIVQVRGRADAFYTSSIEPRGESIQESAPFDPLPAQLLTGAALGARVPLVEQAAKFVEDARQLLRSGSLLIIDYGVPLTAELAMRPWREWLRTYRGNERGEHYLTAPGSQDITTDIPFDQLPEADTMRTQAQFLQRWGIDELVTEGKRVWEAQAARPGLEAMRMRSRISEAEALLDPGGLGNFLVAEWRV